MHVAIVRAYGTPLGTLDVACPAIAGDGLLRNVLPLQLVNQWMIPALGAEVVLERVGATFRWLPYQLLSPPAWASSGCSGVHSPGGRVAVVMYDSPREIRLSSASASSRVVHAGLTAAAIQPLVDAYNALADLVAAVPLPTGQTVATEPSLSALYAAVTGAKSALAAISANDYTTRSVLAPADGGASE